MKDSDAREAEQTRSFLTCESEVELLGANVFIVNSTEQGLHFHYEQIGTVLPGFGHCTDFLEKEH